MSRPTTFALTIPRTEARLGVEPIPGPVPESPSDLLLAAAMCLGVKTEWVRERLLPSEAVEVVKHAVAAYERENVVLTVTESAWRDFLGEGSK